MPLVAKETGYPVEAVAAATAVVEKTEEKPADKPSAGRVLKSSETHPSLKDRSIINQTAWKIVGSVAANYSGDPEKWYDTALKMQQKVEAQMLSVYGD